MTRGSLIGAVSILAIVVFSGATAWGGPTGGQYWFFNNTNLVITDMARDGSAVVGSAGNNNNFHWSENTGSTYIGNYSVVGVSNGPNHIMVGTTNVVCLGNQQRTQCVTFTRIDAPTPLSVLEECTDSEVGGTCLDSYGAAIAGSNRKVAGFRRFLDPLPQNACNTDFCAAVFDSSWTPLPKIPIPPSSSRSVQTIRDIDEAGIHIVGTGLNAGGNTEAFLITTQSITPLGDLPGGIFQSTASAISANGRFVVGSSKSGNGSEAFLWTNGGMQGLGDLPGGTFNSVANDVSDNATVVGRGAAEPGDLYGGGAFIWRPQIGMRPLRQVLQEEYGFFFPVSSFGDFISGDAISADGNRLAIQTSRGILIVDLPVIPVIPGDVNSDGAVDLADIEPFALALTTPESFFEVFPGGVIEAVDANGDGARDSADIAAFVELILP